MNSRCWARAYVWRKKRVPIPVWIRLIVCLNIKVKCSWTLRYMIQTVERCTCRQTRLMKYKYIYPKYLDFGDNKILKCPLSNFCNFLSSYFLSSADIFQNQLFLIILSGMPLDCQTVWIQIRPDILWHYCQAWSGSKLFAKGYQQTALGGIEIKKHVCYIVRLEAWFFVLAVIYFHTLGMRSEKALVGFSWALFACW